MSTLHVIYPFTAHGVLICYYEGSEAGREWLIYDVGGARSLVSAAQRFRVPPSILTVDLQRHAWYPYFDDINAIIFLAPISCFDETLAEDKRVNRLQDSLLLWKAVCSTKILARVQLILVSTCHSPSLHAQ